jgi:AraC-like DNA-binding protein
MGWYVPQAPPQHLADTLACSWVAELQGGPHLLVPDGCVDLLWISRGQIWLCGPETHAWRFQLPLGTTAVGVRFRPGRHSPLFTIETSTLRNERVPLRDIVGQEVERELVAEVAGKASPDHQVRVIESFVHRAVRAAEHGPNAPVARANRKFADAVLELLAHSPRTTQKELAERLGVTPRQLHRRALTVFGYGTTQLSRLLRFQRFLARAEQHRDSSIPIARLAVEAGFSDHAHLGRDCRSITGLAPTAFLAEYFPTFPDMSDPYKTGRNFAVSMAG